MCQFLHHLFDQKVSEGHTPQPKLAVADRVKDSGRDLLVREDRAIANENLLDVFQDTVAQRHLHDNQGLARQRGMEEGEAPAVRRL
jgi:hypothetical protein